MSSLVFNGLDPFIVIASLLCSKIATDNKELIVAKSFSYCTLDKAPLPLLVSAFRESPGSRTVAIPDSLVSSLCLEYSSCSKLSNIGAKFSCHLPYTRLIFTELMSGTSLISVETYSGNWFISVNDSLLENILDLGRVHSKSKLSKLKLFSKGTILKFSENVSLA